MGERRDRALSACSCVMRSLVTSLARSLSEGSWSVYGYLAGRSRIPANLRPFSMAAWLVSTNVTGTLALCAATKAIPRP